MKIINRFMGYLKKDYVLLYKRKKYLYMFLLLPLIIASLFLVALNPSSSSIRAGICDFDNSALSERSYASLNGFIPVVIDGDDCVSSLTSKIEQGKIDMGLVIPEDFSDNIDNLRQSIITVYYDSSDIAFANLMSWKVDQALVPFKRQIIDSLNAELNSRASSARTGVDILLEVGNLPSSLNKKVQSIDDDLRKIEELDSEFVTNPVWTEKLPLNNADVKKDAGIVFVFPILSLFMILMLASTSMMYDKKNGFLTRVKSSSSGISFLVAKVVYFSSLVLVQFLVIMALFLLYGASFVVHPLNMILLIVSVGVIDALLGIIIGLVSNNEGIAVLFSLMVSFPLMLISGVFFPLQILPRVVQWVGSILPLHAQINASKAVLLFGQSFSYSWFWFALGLFILAWLLMRK